MISSLTLRTRSRSLAAVLDAFDSGAVVRGYPMRGTVFAVAASDLRWMTELCASGPVRAAIARRPQLGLDDSHVRTAGAVLEREAGPASARGTGRGLLRADLLAAWNQAGLDTAEGRGYHLLTHLISTGAAAYGPWRDGETAVVLAERWLPEGSGLEQRFNGDVSAATAELLRRYLVSHGPASLRDFAWWSKLALTEIRRALPLIEGDVEAGDPAVLGLPGEENLLFRPGLIEEFESADPRLLRLVQAEMLLPGFDELVLGYRDRLYLMDGDQHRALVPGNNGVFKRGAFRRGRLVGTWARTGAAGRRRLALTPSGQISEAQMRRFEKIFSAFPYTQV